jgi:hypothetical protein
MSTQSTYMSFLIRLWREEDGEEANVAHSPGWQGEVEHIQSGQRWNVENLQEMLDLLRHHTDDSAGQPLPH